MNLVLSTLAALVSTVVILLIVATFVKKEYTIKREIVIKQSRHLVFEYLKHLKNHNQFIKWVMLDPLMKSDFKGTDGTVGFISAWESDNNKVGKGEQEIKRINPEKQIDLEIRFIKPFHGVANSYLTTQSISDNNTLVEWKFESQMAYPMNLMLLVLNMDKMLGNDLQISLNNLKVLLEKC